MKNVVDFYNKTATGWSESILQDKKQSSILQKYYSCFAEAGTKHPKILDLGCGSGYDAKLLFRLGAKVTGVDLSEKNIEIAKKNVINCNFCLGDITENLSRLGKFDGAICLATLIHIDIEKMKQTFDNIANVILPGGLFLVSVYEGNGKDFSKSYVKIDGDEYDKDFNCYTIQSLCSFAYPNFRLVDSWRFDDFKHGWRYYIFMKN